MPRATASVVALVLSSGACVAPASEPTPTATRAAALSTTFTNVPTPSLPSGTYGDALLGVAAVAPGDAWSVGYRSVGSPAYETRGLVEHWDGATWSVVPTPHVTATGFTSEQLGAVWAGDASHAWAVGYAEDPSCLCQKVLALHYDGATWARVAAPEPGIASSVVSLSALGDAQAWAFGASWVHLGGATVTVPLVEAWDGSAWTATLLERFGNATFFAGLAVTGDDVWAAGVQGMAPLVLHFDGKAWGRVPFPSEAGSLSTIVKSLAATSSSDVWAAGFVNVPAGTEGQTTLPRTWHWDGAAWSAVGTPFGLHGLAQGTSLAAIVALSADDAWAAGAGVPAIMHWDGAAWSNVAAGTPGDYPAALGGGAAAGLWAVGQGKTVDSTFSLRDRGP